MIVSEVELSLTRSTSLFYYEFVKVLGKHNAADQVYFMHSILKNHHWPRKNTGALIMNTFVEHFSTFIPNNKQRIELHLIISNTKNIFLLFCCHNFFKFVIKLKKRKGTYLKKYLFEAFGNVICSFSPT